MREKEKDKNKDIANRKREKHKWR